MVRLHILTVSMSPFVSTLTDRECIVNPQTPKIGITVRHRILNSWIRLPLLVSGSPRQQPTVKYIKKHCKTSTSTHAVTVVVAVIVVVGVGGCGSGGGGVYHRMYV